MRILMLTNKVPFPPKDGGAFATLNMALGLVESGAEVTLLAMSTPKHPTTEKDFPESIRKQIKIHTVFVDTKISPVKALHNLIFSKHAYNAQRFISKRFASALENLLDENSYDIVQLEGLYIYPYLNLIRKHFNGKVVLRAHNVEYEIWQRNASIQTNRFKRWYFNHLANRVKAAEVNLLKGIDLLVPISLRDQQMLEQLGYCGASFTSPTGYCLSESGDMNKDFEMPSVFHLGGLDWIPNQEGIFWFLDNCWPHVLSSVPDAKFYVAGRNANQDLITKINGYQNVVFIGEVEDSAKFMRSKAIMVVPLLSGSGMRIKIVEGMALGKAIVSTSIGAEGIDIENDKHLIVADTPYLMAKSIVKLLINKKEILRIGKNAQEFVVQNLDNAILTGNLTSFYKQSLNESNSLI
ncbi:MAG TPA: hypothetical protein DG754_00940 [Bacteroidales bacterium]|jgi:glycosyltransferase involved in cell wall biosynthesis|nr:hypothetical protein [Bacteroidales bacterium]